MIPVSKISVSVRLLLKGRSWSVDRQMRFHLRLHSLLSMASPRTLKIRPRVFSPTGTLIGAPVATASMPRTSPSVLPMAMQRTVSSPRCCATSAVNVVPSCVLMRIASLIFGSLPWLNLISRTALMICVTLPTFCSAMLFLLFL